VTTSPDLFAALHPRSEITADALRQASRLRDFGLSYTVIAVVMGEYHGAYFQPETWRRWLRGMGKGPAPRCGTPRTLPQRAHA